MSDGRKPVEIFFDLRKFPIALVGRVAQLAAAEINKRARSKVRVDKGDLRSSIRTEKEGDNFTVSANTEYAAAQEFGRPDLPRYGFTPYMRPALKETEGKLGEIAQQVFDDAVRDSK